MGLMVKKFNYVSLNKSSGVITIIFVKRGTLVNKEDVGGQFRNRKYLWIKPVWARFGFLQNLDYIESSPTGKQRHVFWNFYMYIGRNDDLTENQDLFLGILINLI